jgi:hypothetical protein
VHLRGPRSSHDALLLPTLVTLFVPLTQLNSDFNEFLASALRRYFSPSLEHMVRHWPSYC